MFTKILHRPALAIVISIILLFLGVLGMKTLPIAQFPNIAPPTVMVSISYPGASANVLVESVLIPLEQSINGVQNMRFITSSATSAGEAAIIIYFEPGTDPNINVVNVQNRVNLVLFQLPPLVVREGILVSQVVPSMLMYVNIFSTDPNADQKDPFNFANVYVMRLIDRSSQTHAKLLRCRRTEATSDQSTSVSSARAPCDRIPAPTACSADRGGRASRDRKALAPGKLCDVKLVRVGPGPGQDHGPASGS